jgi:hypothetical protein
MFEFVWTSIHSFYDLSIVIIFLEKCLVEDFEASEASGTKMMKRFLNKINKK